MADFPERTVTAQTNMAEYERAMRIEKLRKKYGNMLWNASALRGRGWASSSAATKWKSAIDSGGSSLTGLSTRLKMMKEADKEFIGNTFTGNFQDFLTENPDATLGIFNEWANTQGPWYEAERRARDAKVVKDRLEAMKNTKVAEAVDTLFGEYNDEWITGSYAEQNQVRQNIADSDAIKNLPSKWRGSAVDEVIKMLNSFLSPTGQYAKAGEARKVAGEDRKVEELEIKESVRDSANSFIKEYGPAWLTGLRPEQDTVMAELIEEFGDHEHFSLIHKDIMDKLKGMIPLTGVNASAIEARNVVDQRLQEIAAAEATEKHTAAISKTATDKSKNLIASNISSDAAACVLAGDGSPGAREACFQEATAKWAETFPNVVSLISEDSRKRFNAAVEKKAAPPGTKKAYDASTGETIFATDAEIAANDNLVPEESNLEKDYAQVGREMVANGDMLPEVWETYRMGGMDKLDKSITGPDKDVILLWIDEVKKRRARADTPPSINFQMATGASGGQSDDGIKNVIVSPNQ